MSDFINVKVGDSVRIPRRNTQHGVTSIEYALIASLIALAIVVGLSSTGDANALSWETWAKKVVSALRG